MLPGLQGVVDARRLRGRDQNEDKGLTQIREDLMSCVRNLNTRDVWSDVGFPKAEKDL